MLRHIISVGSVTYAIKGRDLLRKHGINAHIERQTNQDGSFGCGYVIIAGGNRQNIITVLANSGIKILGVNSKQ